MFDPPKLSHAANGLADKHHAKREVGVVDIRRYTLYYSRTLKFDPMSLR